MTTTNSGGHTPPTSLDSCDILALVRAANRERVAFHLIDDRLIVHPHRTRDDIVDALIARGEEVAAFLRTYRPYAWRTPPEEEVYRKTMADEMCLTMFSMPWDVCKALVIAHLAEIVGEAWERHVARIPPDAPRWDDDRVHDDRPASPPPVPAQPARSAARYSLRGGGRRG